jgi:uncharacterized protein (TIGR02246 family)
MPLDPDRIAQAARAYTDAWNSGSANAVAEFYATGGSIAINRGAPFDGRARVAEMAEGFFADIPDLKLVCDGVRSSGDHVLYCWTFTGTHARTKRPVRVAGWEEWELGDDYKVTSSKGWFDPTDYARQLGG